MKRRRKKKKLIEQIASERRIDDLPSRRKAKSKRKLSPAKVSRRTRVSMNTIYSVPV